MHGPVRELSPPPARSVRAGVIMSTGTRIVLGVDGNGAFIPALSLVGRLRFPQPTLSLIHVAPENLPIWPMFGDLVKDANRYGQIVGNLGCEALHDATTRACGKNLPSDARLLHGEPAQRLVEQSEVEEADLVAVNARSRGARGRSFIGSVSRALAITSRTSVLISKGEVSGHGPIRAVFATDGSPFADRCLDRFIELHPEGIAEVFVVSAWDIDDTEARLLGQNLAMLGGDVERTIQERVQELATAAADKLTQAGISTRTIVSRGSANEVIHYVMGATGADLLVVGSEGHGAMTRPIVGSVALHQVAAETYPVLIVRPREA